jgi:ketosteroid isomerase-like protein
MPASSGEPRTIENLELVHQSVAAFLAGDLDKVFALMDPRVEFENRTGAPDLEGTYVGREEILGMLVKLNEVFEDYRLEPLRFEGSENQVAVLFRELARGRASGLEIEQRTVFLHTLTDGKVSRIEAFPAPRGELREVLDRHSRTHG